MFYYLEEEHKVPIFLATDFSLSVPVERIVAAQRQGRYFMRESAFVESSIFHVSVSDDMW